MPVDKVRGGYKVRSYVTGKRLKRLYKSRKAAEKQLARRSGYLQAQITEEEVEELTQVKEDVLMAKKTGIGNWLGVFITKRGQQFIVRTPEQLKRARRLKWRQIEGKN